MKKLILIIALSMTVFTSISAKVQGGGTFTIDADAVNKTERKKGSSQKDCISSDI